MLMVLFVSTVAIANAQNIGRLNILNVEPSDQGDSLRLDMIFSIIDDTGTPLTETPLEQVIVELADGQQIPANVTQPQLPIAIALVLDASGSMEQSNPTMRAAAIQAVSNPPPNARFAVFTFNDTVQKLQGFDSAGVTQSTIDSVRSTPNAGTCLFDAIQTAIDETALQPNGRRAVIVFTDGVDERGDGTGPCSSIDALGIARYAQRPELGTRIPIYTIGLDGDSVSGVGVNEAELSIISQSTGAFSRVGGESDLATAFGTVLNALRNQWLAQVTLYPRAGANQINLIPYLEGGIALDRTPVNFTSPRDFVPPLSLAIDDLIYTPEQNILSFMVRASGISRASTVSFAFLAENGTRALEQIVDPIAVNLSEQPTQIAIPLTGLIANSRYVIRVTPLNSAGQSLLVEPLTRQYVHLPLGDVPAIPVQMTLDSQRLREDGACILLRLTTLGTAQVRETRFTITSEDGLTIGDPVNVPSAPTEVCLPRIGVISGERYTVTIQPISFNGSPLLDEALVSIFSLPVPPPLSLTFGSVAVSPDADSICIDLIGTNLGTVKMLEISISLQEVNRLVYGPERLNGVPDQHCIPTEDLQAAEYVVSAIPYDANNEPLIAESFTSEFAYAPPTPSFLQSLGGFFGHPLILGVLIAGFIFGGLFLLRSRSRSGRVAQLGNNVLIPGNKPTGPSIIVTPENARHDPTDYIIASTNTKTPGTIIIDVPPSRLPAIPAAQLYIRDAKTQIGQTIDLKPEIVQSLSGYVVGRGVESHLSLIDDLTVSARHLIISYDIQNGVYIIEDVSNSAKTATYIQDLGQPDFADAPKRLRGKHVVQRGSSVTIKLGDSVWMEMRVYTGPMQNRQNR